jgi:hypothetical protein
LLTVTRNAAWFLACAVCVAVTGAVLTIVPALEPDAAWGVLASEQVLRGSSDSLLAVTVSAGPSGAPVSQTITWWAPGQQYMVHALRRAGLSPGTSIRTIVAFAWLAGVALWARYFLVVLGDSRSAALLIVAFVLFRMSHYSAFIYQGGETLLWALFPAVVLLNVAALDRTRVRPDGLAALGAGVAASVIVLVKYSAALLAGGIAVSWFVTGLRDSKGVRAAAWWIAGAGTGALAIAWAGLARALSGPTPATAYCVNEPVATVALGIMGPLMSASDAVAALETAMRLTGKSAPSSALLIGAALALAAVLAFWIVSSPRAFHISFVDATAHRAAALLIATSVTGVVALGLIALRLRGGCISLEGRHQQYGAFLLLPFLVAGIRVTGRQLVPRAAAVLCVVAFVGFPALYGAAALIDKRFVRWPALAAAVGPDGIRWDWAGPAAGEVATAISDRGADALLVTTNAATAAAFPDHRLLIAPPPAAPQYTSAADVLLVEPVGQPKEFSAVIRSMFPSVRSWRQIPLPETAAVRLFLSE